MNKPLSMNDFKKLEDNLKESIEADKQYWRVNNVKCDAIHTAKTYEEFSDRVAAAHLRPLDKTDKVKTVNLRTTWNTVARDKHRQKEN